MMAGIEGLQVACRICGEKNQLHILQCHLLWVGSALIEKQDDFPVLTGHLAIQVGHKLHEHCRRHPSLLVSLVSTRQTTSMLEAAGFLILAYNSNIFSQPSALQLKKTATHCLLFWLPCKHRP